MKDKAIVGNIGHFDNEIEMAALERMPGVRRENVKPQYADSDEVNTLVRGMWVTRSEGSGPPDPGMWSGVVGAKRRWSDQVVDSGACLLMEAPLSWMRWA